MFNESDLPKLQQEIHTRLCLLWDEGLLTRENAAQAVDEVVNGVVLKNNIPEFDISVNILSKGDRVIEVSIQEK